MERAITRQPIPFMLRTDLLSALKERAREYNRSLNDYVEGILSAAISTDEPNEITMQAIEEAKMQAKAIKEGRLNVTPVDTSSVESMLASIGV